MTAAPARLALAATVEEFNWPAESIRQQLRQIHQAVLSDARQIFEPNFTSVHTHDLELLFQLYDQRFFGGRLRAALHGSPIAFRPSPRLTRAGGKTTRYTSRLSGEERYEIAIAVGMLFDGFRNNDREITVCGLPCTSRLEAMQRIFEHELVHLAEMLCWGKSQCAAPRFQDIARRMFLHQAHTHDLVTRRELAAKAGIRRGSLVTFAFEGIRLTGRVNRITKRATVLVEDPQGRPYTDGKRYRIYYVPIGALQPLEGASPPN